MVKFRLHSVSTGLALRMTLHEVEHKLLRLFSQRITPIFEFSHLYVSEGSN